MCIQRIQLMRTNTDVRFVKGARYDIGEIQFLTYCVIGTLVLNKQMMLFNLIMDLTEWIVDVS